MKPKIFLCALFAMTAAPGTVQAGPSLTGNELLTACKDSNEATQGFCLGYIVGVIEGLKWGGAAPLLMTGATASEADKFAATVLGFCLPDADATYGQYQDVVVGYLAENPKDRHNSARILTQIALTRAFPCAKP